MGAVCFRCVDIGDVKGCNYSDCSHPVDEPCPQCGLDPNGTYEDKRDG